MASPRPATTQQESTKSGGKNRDKRSIRVGRAVQVARTLRGFTQRELAKQIGRSQNYIWLVESGKTDPGVLFLTDVAQQLEVPVELFLLAVAGPRAKSKPEQAKLFEEGRGLLFQLIDSLAEVPKGDLRDAKKRKQRSR